MPFVDQFSMGATEYAAHRPRYPEALFDAVAKLAARRDVALDVATGSGQAAAGLVGRFAHVVAVDGGVGQLAAAGRGAGFALAAAVAERLPVRAASCDAITVAQALHWFDREAFFAEVDRLLRPGGVLAVWLYMLAEVEPAIDAALRRFYEDVVGPYWLAGRRLVDEGYRGVELPFRQVVDQSYVWEAKLSLAGYLSYVGTWSAVARSRQRTGRDPILGLAAELGHVWGPPDTVRAVRWPIRLRASVRR